MPTRTKTRVRAGGPRSSHVGSRRAQAAAERRVLSVVVVLAVAAVAAWLVMSPKHSVAIAAGAPSVVHAQAAPLSLANAVPTRASVAPRALVAGVRTAVRSSVAARPVAIQPAAIQPQVASSTVAATQTGGKAGTRAVASVASASTRSLASATSKPRGTITIETFGYDYGKAPAGCRFVADVRNIDAGNFTPSQTGLQASVRNRVMATSAAKKWHRIMQATWLPKLNAGDKVGIGCARGHHRSVSLAVVFAQDLRAKGFTVRFVHRDIKKTW